MRTAAAPALLLAALLLLAGSMTANATWWPWIWHLELPSPTNEVNVAGPGMNARVSGVSGPA